MTRGDAAVIALAGNPNTGKSSIFNRLTGLTQHTGNWPGKTVSKAEGSFERGDHVYKLIDLPGTYSMNASSPEERIARDYLISNEPDVVVVVVDAANLERNLYLVVQVMEMGKPTVIALNMIDSAKAHGFDVDPDALARNLGVPVIPTAGRKGEGLDLLVETIRLALPMEVR